MKIGRQRRPIKVIYLYIYFCVAIILLVNGVVNMSKIK